MRFLFVMDPAENMLPDKDTSFAFMRAAIARGHQLFHCAPEDLSLAGDQLEVRCTDLKVADQSPHVVLGSTSEFRVAELDAVFIRKDPPFDTAYLHLTQELDIGLEQTVVMNHPAGLRAANEKLFALQFHHLMPRTAVTRDREKIFDFVRDGGGQAVLKPLDGAGGSGVVALFENDKNLKALVDLLTSEGQEQAMVQEFKPSVEKGDKRVLLLDGELLGAIRRVPRADDIRANIHVGGTVEATELTAREMEIVQQVGPVLRKHGLYFVGLDMIGESLIEINVTSPTGIQELGRLTNSCPEDQVIAWVEKKRLSLG
ncbi:MAG: glutathione synthase [Polyangiaceae bacterium]|nr:glutathione synthase [Polyangiaceae bacterium]